MRDCPRPDSRSFAIMGRKPKNPFVQDEIVFTEHDHKYIEVKTGKQLISVSTLISKYSEPFDPTGIILYKCAQKRGISKEELRAEWDKKRDDSCVKGTKFHEQAEEWILTGKIPDGPDKKIVTKFAKEIKFNGTVFPEILVYNIELGIAGQSDLAIYNKKDNSVAIQDYKTNAEMYKKVYKKLLYPLGHLNDTKINKYALQASTYSYLLELKGFKIRADELCLYWIKEDGFEIIPVPYLRDDVIKMISHYSEDAF